MVSYRSMEYGNLKKLTVMRMKKSPRNRIQFRRMSAKRNITTSVKACKEFVLEGFILERTIELKRRARPPLRIRKYKSHVFPANKIRGFPPNKKYDRYFRGRRTGAKRSRKREIWWSRGGEIGYRGEIVEALHFWKFSAGGLSDPRKMALGAGTEMRLLHNIC